MYVSQRRRYGIYVVSMYLRTYTKTEPMYMCRSMICTYVAEAKRKG